MPGPLAHRRLSICIILAMLSIVLAGSSEGAFGQQISASATFSFPLGFVDGQSYSPRINHDDGNLIENTDFDAQNPDLSGYSNCFEAAKSQLHHGGEDLYRTDGTSTANAEVTSVADGVVIEYNPDPSFDYPGKAIVVEHALPSDDIVYSVYMHLQNVQVTQGQEVYRGQTLGYVLYQQYDGNFPDFHASNYNGDDSHLHFEIRHFGDAAAVYEAYNGGQYAACNKGDKAGRGYTPPDVHAYDFPAPGQGYIDPTDFINSHQATPTGTEMGTPTPTGTPTSTVTPTATATPVLSQVTLTCHDVNEPYDLPCEQLSPHTIRFRGIDGQVFSSYSGKFVMSDYLAPLKGFLRVTDGGVYTFRSVGYPGAKIQNGGGGWSYTLATHDAYAGNPEPYRSYVEAGDYDFEYYRDGPAPGSIQGVSVVPGSGMGATRWNKGSVLYLSSRPLELCVLEKLRPGLIDIVLFQRVRSEIVDRSPEGHHYIDLYYAHTDEIAGLVLADQALQDEGVSVLRSWEPNLQALLDGEGASATITAEQVAAVQTFLNHLSAAGSPGLADAIAEERARQPLEQAVGKTMDEAGRLFIGYPPPSVSVIIGGVGMGTHAVPADTGVQEAYGNVNAGPVAVTGSGGSVVSSIRALYGGTSYAEMVGFPNDTTTDFWFPWYNNVAMDSQFGVTNLGSSTTTITVTLRGSQIDQFNLDAGAAIRKNYTGENGGPMHVSSSSAPILSTIRVLYGGASYSEMMGFPNVATTDFDFPWYNNVAMDSQFRVSNVGSTSTTITVTLHGTQIDQFTLAAGAAVRKNYAAQNSGPMHVSSSAAPILATIRVLYGGTSYSEMMGFPNTATTDFWFPWYDNVNADSQFRVSNLGGSSTAITVYLAGTQIDQFTLAANSAVRKNYVSQNNGALHIVSGSEPILATVRVLYGGTSFYEVMGYPGNALTSTQFFPWYDSTTMDSQLRLAVH